MARTNRRFSRACAAQIGVRPEETVLFGRRAAFLQSAREAGMITCGVWDPSAAPTKRPSARPPIII